MGQFPSIVHFDNEKVLTEENMQSQYLLLMLCSKEETIFSQVYNYLKNEHDQTIQNMITEKKFQKNESHNQNEFEILKNNKTNIESIEQEINKKGYLIDSLHQILINQVPKKTSKQIFEMLCPKIEISGYETLMKKTKDAQYFFQETIEQTKDANDLKQKKNVQTEEVKDLKQKNIVQTKELNESLYKKCCNIINFQYKSEQIKNLRYFMPLISQYLFIPIQLILSSIQLIIQSVIYFFIRFIFCCCNQSCIQKQQQSDENGESYYEKIKQLFVKRIRQFKNLDKQRRCSPVTFIDYLKFWFFIGLILLYAISNQKNDLKNTSNQDVKIMVIFTIGKQMLLFFLEILAKITNVYVTYQLSLQDKIDSIEKIQASDQYLYLEFARDPIEFELKLQIQIYYLEEILQLPDSSHFEQIMQKDNTYIFPFRTKKKYNALSIFYQYLFSSNKYPLGEFTQGINKNYLKEYNQRIFERVYSSNSIIGKLYPCYKVIIQIIKYLVFLLIFINMIAFLFFDDDKTIYSNEYGSSLKKYSKKFSNLMFVLLFDFSSQTKNELIAYRYSIFRLTAMITFDRNDPKLKNDLPCINLFCLTSIQSWYSLRKLTFQQNVLKKNITNFHVILEFFIALTLVYLYWPNIYSFIMFYDCNQHFQNFLILAVLLYKIIIVSLFTTVYEFSQVNQAYFTHLDILKDILNKLKRIQPQYNKLSQEFIKNISEESNFKTFIDQNNNNPKMYWTFEAVKEIKRCSIFFLMLEEENVNDNNDYNYRQNVYIQKLIDTYTFIINNLEQNQYENQLLFLGIFPLNFEHVQSLILAGVPFLGRLFFKFFKSADLNYFSSFAENVYRYFK